MSNLNPVTVSGPPASRSVRIIMVYCDCDYLKSVTRTQPGCSPIRVRPGPARLGVRLLPPSTSSHWQRPGHSWCGPGCRPRRPAGVPSSSVHRIKSQLELELASEVQPTRPDSESPGSSCGHRHGDRDCRVTGSHWHRHVLGDSQAEFRRPGPSCGSGGLGLSLVRPGPGPIGLQLEA